MATYKIPEQTQPKIINDHGLTGQLADQNAARDKQRRALQPGFKQGPQPPRRPEGAMQPIPGAPTTPGTQASWQTLMANTADRFPALRGRLLPMDDGRTQLLNALMRLRLGGQPPSNQPRLGTWQQAGMTNNNGVS